MSTYYFFVCFWCLVIFSFWKILSFTLPWKSCCPKRRDVWIIIIYITTFFKIERNPWNVIFSLKILLLTCFHIYSGVVLSHPTGYLFIANWCSRCLIHPKFTNACLEQNQLISLGTQLGCIDFLVVQLPLPWSKHIHQYRSVLRMRGCQCVPRLAASVTFSDVSEVQLSSAHLRPTR